MNDENENLKMRRTEVGKIAVEVSAEKALAVLWDIKSIECYEPKADSALVIPGTQNKGTYFARGRFAGIPWSGLFTYELNHHGFYSEMNRGAFGVKVQGGFVVTSESSNKCLITHYERYEFPCWLSPLSLFVRLYLHRAMKKELGNLVQLIHQTVRPYLTEGAKMNKSIMPALLTTIVVLFAACSQPAGVNQERTNNAAPTVMPGAGFVYTANERGNSISVIDPSTGQVKAIATHITPHNVQVSRDGRLLLAVGPVAAMTEDQSQMEMNDDGKMERGRLLIFDTGTMSIEGATEIEVGREPAHVVVDAQNGLVCVTNAMDNNLSVVDLKQKKVVATIPTGKMPHGLRLSPGGREIYVANVNDISVSVIDITQSKEVTRIPVGKAPAQVGFTPDGRRAYVSLRDENSVAVIDTAQRKKIATVAVGRNPIQVFATPDGRYVYVANQGTETNPDNTVSVIETANNSVVATIETGKGAHGVVVSDDGRRAFITNIVDDTVSVIDTATRKVTNNIKVGKGPNGITFRSASSPVAMK